MRITKPELFKPEKFVETQILAWAFQNRWDLEVFDSRAIAYQGKKRRNPGVPVGMSDLAGHSDIGLAVYIELKKAKGENLCRLSQHQFLSRKIQSGAFGIVTSSPEHLFEVYSKWLSLRGTKEAEQYLLRELPRKVLVDGKVISLGT